MLNVETKRKKKKNILDENDLLQSLLLCVPYLRLNISVTNGKQLIETVEEIRVEYFNELMKKQQ
jgi:hypothetical protein